MNTPSKLLPLFLALLLFLIPLTFILNTSTQTYKPFHGLTATTSNHRHKNIDHSFSVSKAISLNITHCFPAELPSNPITDNHCCPSKPSFSNLIDFKDFASPNATLRVRKPFHMLDEQYIAKFEKGIALMKALPQDDPRSFIQQAKVHCAYCNGAYHLEPPFQDTKFDIHVSWFFFPFHRWYMYFFERILGNLIGDPHFALPFWNWDSAEGMQMPSCFTDHNSSLYNQLRHQKHLPPHVVDLNYHLEDSYVPSQQQVSYNLATMYKQMVLASTTELFMGSPFRLGDNNPHPGMGSVEVAPHNTLHSWIGGADTPHHEDMGTFYTAARDPIFYVHHANMDRMWAIWKTLGEGRRDYSDEDWLDSEFYFYDENADFVRVKVRDCVDTKKLGYVYQDVDLPWLRTPPTSRKSKLLRQRKKDEVLSWKPIKFPLVLDSVTSVIVKRPKKKRSREEREKEEEVLVMEGIEFGSDKYVKFDVHVDDDEERLSNPDETEFVGSFVNVAHGHGHNITTTFKVAISKVLENLEVAEDDDVLVTLVPRVGQGDLILGNIKIEFFPRELKD
ncbi:polyphenol oxidase I, chloroplastic-like [Vigna unguiculata]|uniref:polyphenol oxidase I, chloroplastic-like n=1 Tax=Vigna unguiculata TaxID=3917 RepID=UPI001016CDB4|nr:polyphenol oxidase I, chloroplastic-like [Vigna unguiculata]